MHELHPGVQDMAVETLLTIAQKCRRKFVVPQADDKTPFVEEVRLIDRCVRLVDQSIASFVSLSFLQIVSTLPVIVRDLANPQVHVFYEAVGTSMSISHVPSVT